METGLQSFTISAHRAELAAAILALKVFSRTPLDLITDSHNYWDLPAAALNTHTNRPLLCLFLEARSLLQHRLPRCLPFTGSRSHQPGPLAEGHNLADS